MTDKEALKFANEHTNNGTDKMPRRFISLNGADFRVIDAFLSLGWEVRFVTTAVTTRTTAHCYHLELPAKPAAE